MRRILTELFLSVRTPLVSDISVASHQQFTFVLGNVQLMSQSRNLMTVTINCQICAHAAFKLCSIVENQKHVVPTLVYVRLSHVSFYW